MPRALVLACVLASSSVAAAQPFPPRVAVSADGSFVVSSVSSTGISGQRFDPSGGPIGPFTVQDAVQPGANHSIAADADGDFVVAWFRTDNSVRGQRFDGAGGQRGGSFVVTRNGYYDTAAAMTANGSFVVAWANYQDVAAARRYDAAGQPLGSEINLTGSSPAYAPSIAIRDDGAFVATWMVNGGLEARLFDQAGSPLGEPFRVDDPANMGVYPTTDMAADGSFVIAWQANHGATVFAQRFAAAGGRLGPVIQVNRGGIPLYRTSVAMTDAGDFFVFWTCCQVEATSEVLGQHFDRLGRRVGPELAVSSSSPAALRSAPGASIGGDRTLVVAWTNYGESLGTTFRRYELAASGDADGDGVSDYADNCPTVANPEQTDPAGDGYGDDCVAPDVVIPASSSFGRNPVIGSGTLVLDRVSVGDDAVLGERVLLDREVTIGHRFKAEDFVVIGRGTSIGDDVAIGFATRIEPGVRIGNGVTLGDQVLIKRNAVLGDGATVEPLAIVFQGARIGAGATLEMGARIGRRAYVRPGAVVPAGTSVPPGVTFP